jgi:hypothetical protein
MRSKLFTSFGSVAALLAGTLCVAAQSQPNGTPSTQPPQGREQLGNQQTPRTPSEGTVGRDSRQELVTPREREEKLPLQPGGRPANEPPQGKGADN